MKLFPVTSYLLEKTKSLYVVLLLAGLWHACTLMILKCTLPVFFVLFFCIFVYNNWSELANICITNLYFRHCFSLFICPSFFLSQIQCFPSMRRESFLMESTGTLPSLEVQNTILSFVICQMHPTLSAVIIEAAVLEHLAVMLLFWLCVLTSSLHQCASLY